MDDLRQYHEMRDKGATPLDVCMAAKRDGFQMSRRIKMLINVFGLSLVEAKDIFFQSEGSSLLENQEKLYEELKDHVELED